MKKNEYLIVKNKAKYFCFCLLYFVMFLPALLIYHRKNRWLISEVGKTAQDNGYVFYKYLKNNHKNIKVSFLLNKNSNDVFKIDKKDLVYFGSFKHFMMAIGCKVQLSSHLFGYCPWVSFSLFLRKHKTPNIHVFLQHGITYNNQLGFYKSVAKALTLYICGAKYEQQYICSTFGYNNDEAIYTGFSRFDNLTPNNHNNLLVVMPTWRRYLHDVTYDEFTKSNYFLKWDSLLKDQTLIDLCNKHGLKIVFYLHAALQKFSNVFKNYKNVITVSYGEESVQNLLKQAKMLITDYSSVFFDCLYMNKPVFLYRFDYQTFIKEHYQEGYFDTLDKNIINVAYDKNELLKKISVLIEQDYKSVNQLIEEYSLNFFGKIDHNNCDRIFEAIINKM